mmetsp:Transcript_6165/g.10353  ORF Transcript_6165/g.10353 Transcript_6165/m.10353 type:complete len:103 (-) Transcript_6165:155-463(-)
MVPDNSPPPPSPSPYCPRPPFGTKSQKAHQKHLISAIYPQMHLNTTVGLFLMRKAKAVKLDATENALSAVWVVFVPLKYQQNDITNKQLFGTSTAGGEIESP